MRTILNLHPWTALDVLRVWIVAAVFAATHARVARCPVCHATVRVDDRKTLTRQGLAHVECARHRRMAAG